MKAVKKMQKRLDRRRVAFQQYMDSLPVDKQTGYTCPGSMNQRKKA